MRKIIITSTILISFLIPNSFAKPLVFDTIPACDAGFTYARIDSLISSFRGPVFAFTSNAAPGYAYHQWSVNDTVFSYETNPVYKYYGTDSMIRVCHIAMDGDCTQCTYCENIPVENILPTYCNAYFAEYRDSIDTCECVAAFQFYDYSYPNPVSRMWYFGDGDSSYLINPRHEYMDSGYFTVTLRIVTSENCTSEYSKNVYVSSTDRCDFQIGYSPSQIDPYQYRFYSNASGTVIVTDSLPGDTFMPSLLNYYWDFGDGNYSYQPSPYHTFSYSGYYTVSLSISYPDGYYCYTSVYDYFYGIIPSGNCRYSGTFYRNYGSLGFDAILSDVGNFFIHQIMVPDSLPDIAQIGFDYENRWDTIYVGDTMFTGIDVNCISQTNPVEYITGTVKDYSWLDGCGYIIKSDNGETFEPAIVDMNFVFRDNQRVRFTYLPADSIGSFCMAGLPVEITYIEEIPGDTIYPPQCSDEITLHTSTGLNNDYCNGSAYIEIMGMYGPWSSVIPCYYHITWSNGQTGDYISGLCPNTLYFVNVLTPSGKNISAAFSIFKLNNLFPSWYFTRDDNIYSFKLPVDATYNVQWKFDDGTVYNGNSVSYTFNGSGQHYVELSVKDQTGTQVYYEMIELEVPAGMPEKKTENIKVYPIPAGDVLNIDLTEMKNKNDLTFLVTDVSGRKLLENRISSNSDQFSIDLSGVNKGIYFLVIKGINENQMIKFIKE